MCARREFENLVYKFLYESYVRFHFGRLLLIKRRRTAEISYSGKASNLQQDHHPGGGAGVYPTWETRKHKLSPARPTTAPAAASSP